MSMLSLSQEVGTELQEWDCNGRAALVGFGLTADCDLKLLSLSENAIYLVTEPVSRKHHILRLHRPGYRSRAEIESELAWIEAIRGQGIAATPRAFYSQDGHPVAEFNDMHGQRQHAVLFEHIDGMSPESNNLTDAFMRLGSISADLHLHSKNWRLPAGFTRPVWDEEAAIGINGHWGHWQNNNRVGSSEVQLLKRLETELRKNLASYGRPVEKYGLIHGDMRQSNIILQDGKINLIDFDDCGFSWHLYELACSLSFIEAHPNRDDFTVAWLNGYRQTMTLNDDDLEIIPTLVMLRRLLLIGWFSTHQHTTEARELNEFIPDTLEIAEQFLSGYYLKNGISC